MSEKAEIKYVDKGEYRIYNLAIERLAKAITELGYAIENCKNLEDRGYDMNAYKLEEAMVDIATVFAGLLQVLNTLSQKKARCAMQINPCPKCGLYTGNFETYKQAVEKWNEMTKGENND